MIKKLKTIFKTEWFIITFIFKTNVKLSIIYLITVIFIKVIPLINLLIWKVIIDKFVIIFTSRYNDNSIWLILLIYLSLQVFSSILYNIENVISTDIEDLGKYKLDTQIMDKISLLDACFFDDPKNIDKINVAEMSEVYITSGLTWMINTLIQSIMFIISSVVFLSYNFIYGIIFLITYIPGAYITFKNNDKLQSWTINNIPQNRKKDYYRNILTQSWAAKDLRLYNLADYFKTKYNNCWNIIRNERDKIFRKSKISSFLANLLSYSGIIIIIIYSVKNIVQGNIKFGTFALYIGLIENIGNQFETLSFDISCQIQIQIPYIQNFLKFINYKNKINKNGEKLHKKVPDIEFKNVYFKYPNNKDYVLKNLSFKIESGKKIAIIGINGAGKSTIVKLLLRFYEPQYGEILIDGKNINRYSLDSLYNIFGVCFQDVNKYSLTLRENIALSNINNKDNTSEIEKAASLSGINDIYKKWPAGLNTQMTRQFDDKGEELSGGQWQKIALARTFFRKSDIIILDEPSSSLDPKAEDNVFSSFKKLCKNKGGIIISHRLSSIIMVDEILLLQDGAIFEKGTHEELMFKHGKYAELYLLQSEKYRR